MLCPHTFSLCVGICGTIFPGQCITSSGEKGCPSPIDKVLKSKALHIYDSTNSGVVSMEPWVLMDRGRCSQFPSPVDGVGAMASDGHSAHTTVTPVLRRGLGLGLMLCSPTDTFSSFFLELVPQSYFAMSLAQ